MSNAETFPSEVIEKLQTYVYRLIDPRNGETFYVGKGTGNRVFMHAAGQFSTTEQMENLDPPESPKLERIRRIQLVGMQVQHVIHRYGMDDKTAFEVEAAVMDAYPGLTNVAGGHGSAERGVAHATEILRAYSAKPVAIQHSVVEITINRTAAARNAYDATRFAWKLDVDRARKTELVLAVVDGIIVDVFTVKNWLSATAENFPSFEVIDSASGRYGFDGAQATHDVHALYIGKRMPKKAFGAANPIRYLEPA